ncbi:hypothetical protein V8E54_014762 [Elaphomyces granulatus]
MADRTPNMPAHPSDQQIAYPTTQTIIGEPLPDAEHESHEAVENAYRQHALGKGYGVVKVDTGGLKKYSKKSGSTQKCTNRSAERERAQGSATAHSTLLPLRLKWKAVIKEEHHSHNHDLSPEPTSHRRAGIANLSELSKQMVDRLRLRNTPVSTVRAQLGDMGVKVTSKDLYNIKQRARNAQLGGLLQELRWFCRFELRRISSLMATPNIKRSETTKTGGEESEYLLNAIGLNDSLVGELHEAHWEGLSEWESESDDVEISDSEDNIPNEDTNAFDGKHRFWAKKGEQPLRPKGMGKGIMVSGFLTPGGILRVPDHVSDEELSSNPTWP